MNWPAASSKISFLGIWGVEAPVEILEGLLGARTGPSACAVLQMALFAHVELVLEDELQELAVVEAVGGRLLEADRKAAGRGRTSAAGAGWSRVGWWSCWESEAIGGQVADQGMGLEKAELDNVARGCDERSQVAQAEAGALRAPWAAAPFQGVDRDAALRMQEALAGLRIP